MAGRSYGPRAAQFQQAMHSIAGRRGNIPILRLALGVVVFGFFVLALMLQTQTSEAFILNSKAVTLAANWAILQQPFDLIQGHLPIDMAKAVMWGWGIELVYLVCVIGEVTVHGRFLAWFRTGAIALVAFDFWTDFNYGNLASGMGGQLAFAAIVSFIVAFFGIIGLNLIWDAILDLTH